MKWKFDTHYSDEELQFLRQHQCEIIAELKLSKAGFLEIPRRMIRYGGAYFAEIEDEDGLCWAMLGKSRKGESVFTSCYADLQSIIEGF